LRSSRDPDHVNLFFFLPKKLYRAALITVEEFILKRSSTTHVWPWARARRLKKYFVICVFCHCNVSYFEYCTESVLNRHKSHLIYFKNRTKIFRPSNLRFLDWRIPSNLMIYNFFRTWVYFHDLGMCEYFTPLNCYLLWHLRLTVAERDTKFGKGRLTFCR
jgi:hypothetical protein